MKLRIVNLKMPLEHNKSQLLQKTLKQLAITEKSIKSFLILRQSLDARDKEKIFFVYTVEIEVEKAPQHLPKNVSVVTEKTVSLARGNKKLHYSPVIVGLGPAGLFAAWKLAAWGYAPVVIERGQDIFTRSKEVVQFWRDGILNPESNVQFGEGGAGTFSDGKLTTRVKDYRINEVLEILVNCGAPEEILYKHKPHVGTDLLRNVVWKMRKKIEEKGGQVFFGACLTDIEFMQNKLQGLTVNHKIDLPSEICVLAPGHSARDTYAMLAEKKVTLDAKAFAVGLRMEHRQDFINKAQYGGFAHHPALGAADYALTYQDSASGRGVFSFCMCPGGQVIAATSEAKGVVTNGMSSHARASGLANSALVASVTPIDYPGEGALAGIEFQRILEKKAFQLGGGNYQAPACDIQAFLEDRADLEGEVMPSYLPGTTKANLWELFPKDIAAALAEGLKSFAAKINNFSEHGVLTGIESRTSAPIRILRNSEMQSPDVEGLYPVGEGAGYAGGIVSAAIDGLKVAEKIIENYEEPLEKFALADMLTKEMN